MLNVQNIEALTRPYLFNNDNIRLNKETMMINIWERQSVRGQNHPMMQKAQGRVARLYIDKGYPLMISSRGDSEHSPGSFHYLELTQAEDYKDPDKHVSKAEIKKVVGLDFDVIEYSWGYHVEYDPT